ncbi:MAG: EamA family transporter RarD [Pseudomonadota bacterium]
MTNISAKDSSSAVRDGLLFGVIAYTLWGLFPIYLKAVGEASALEILAHRILWSVPFGAVLIALRKQWGEVRKALTTPRVLVLLGVSALAISFNWLIYVWSVVNDRILEASLGYYINPLMYVAAGVFILGERLRPAQIVAVCLATIGVLVLTFGAGVFPWVSLTLAVLFTVYGYIRKTTPVGAMPGLFVETTLLSPLALIYLLWLMNSGTAVFLQSSITMDTLLVLAGPVTVVPLVLFALSARRLRLSTLGFLQYIGPTLQFVLGLYYGEPFTWAHGVCFGLIWTGLAVFSFDAARASRAEKLMKTA